MHKTMVYLKGFAKGKQYWNMLKAIQYAIELHENQKRKSGEPYIEHPMMVTALLVALGVHNERILTASTMHDVEEDCNLTMEDLINKFGLDRPTAKLIDSLSKKEGISDERYYMDGQKDVEFIVVKAGDRFHNISTMTGAFSIEKMKQYVKETEDFIIPMCKYGVNHYPEYSDVITVLRINIQSMLNTIKWFLANMEKDVK